MSRNSRYYERHRNDLPSKMANLVSNHIQQQRHQHHQQRPVVASKQRRLKMQARFVILLLTLVSAYRTATSSATTINEKHPLANTTGASNSSSNGNSNRNNTEVEDDFVLWGLSKSGLPSMFTDHLEPTDNGTSKKASNLLGQQAVVGFGDYGALFPFSFDRLVSVLMDQLFELNEMVELDCSKGMRSASPSSAPRTATTKINQMNSPFINHLVATNSRRHKRGARLKRSSSLELEVESDATLINTNGEAQPLGGESKKYRVHREAPPARRGSPHMIRSVNPARNITHMDMLMGNGRDTTTSPGHASNAAPFGHFREVDQDHLYDERNFDRAEADDSLRHKSNRKARRQSSSASSGARKERARQSSSTTRAPSTSTTAPSSPHAVASITSTVVSEQGLGGGESTVEPPTASPDQSAGAALESGNLESPISEQAMPQPTEQPAGVYNDQDSIDDLQNQRPVDLQAQPQADDGGGGQSDTAQVELLPRRARLDQRQRANLMAGGDHQQGASQVPATSSSLSAQIPPPEQSPLKRKGSSSHHSHHGQHQKGRHLQTGNLVFTNNGFSGNDSSNSNADQQQDLVPQVGDAQVLEHSSSSSSGGGGGADPTKEQQLRQLLRLYEMNENSLAKRLKGRQPPNTSDGNHHNHNRASSISSMREYPSQQHPPYLNKRQFYHYQQQLSGDLAATVGGASPPQIVIRSQAPYAVPSNGVGGPTTMSQISPYANGENYPQNSQAQSSLPQALAALDSIDGGPQISQQAIISNHMRLSPAAAAALPGQIHRPAPSGLSADAASQIEENFYNSNSKYATAAAAAAAAAAALVQMQQQQLLQEQAASNNNNNIELQPSTKLRRTTGSSSAGGGATKQALNTATNRYGSRGNRVTSLPAIDASQTPDHGQLVQGLLRATNPIAYGSTTASSTIRAQHSSPLLRRTSPLVALPASVNNNQQLALIGTPYRGGATTAYLLPAGHPQALPYSSTSARYIKQSYTNGPIQRQMMNTGSQHRMGKIATYNGATNSAANNNNNNNNNYDDSPSGGSTQASVPATATSDPMWSDTQNQEDDYQQAPQTIQITAVPNGFGGGLWNGGVNGFNPLVGAGWNGGWGGPWNGRQVLLVNKSPTQTVGGLGSEWRQWVLPVAAVLALPLVLGALFVPVFLKSIMFLIQILQMLGLLMPPAQLAGHLASSSHNNSSG